MSSALSSAHSPNFPSLQLRHSSLSNPSIALPTSQFILEPFRCFIYVTAHSPTLLSLLLRHRIFTWRAAHGEKYVGNIPISPLGTPLSSVHGFTHCLQMNELQYAISRTTIQLQIENDNRQTNAQLSEYKHAKQNGYGILHQPIINCKDVNERKIVGNDV